MSEAQASIGPPDTIGDGMPGAQEFPCQCAGTKWVPTPASCVCEKTERLLRAYAYVDAGTHPPLTPEQREWCLKQLDRVEGYGRDGFKDNDDMWLCRTVLNAWADFAKDKGAY